MHTYRPNISQNIKQSESSQTRATQIRVIKLENRHFWFFFGVAPLAVMAGWSLVGLCLTGNWAWELPMGLLFSFIGSLAAMLSTLFKL